MAEFALRGYNVALPGVDQGDDIFVVDDKTGNLWRIQVKGATQQKASRNYQVIVKEEQIQTRPDGPDRHSVFALRRDEEKCWRFVVMARTRLKKYIDDRKVSGNHRGKFGRVHTENNKDRRTLTIVISRRAKRLEQVSCSYENWEMHMEDWSEWPRLDHEATVG